ncbi:MAG: hypothetical protein JRE64_24220 [Deltaproteobacteria bacterium]|nr:hypothetical protein [Deltaproteobacteria bacterium]
MAQKWNVMRVLTKRYGTFGWQEFIHDSERGRWFQNDLWLNKSVQNGSVQNVSIRLMRFHEI